MPTPNAKYRKLPTVKPSDFLLNEIERRLIQAFIKEIYSPIAKILKTPLYKIVTNAKTSAITSALWKGKISYSNGVFRGKFTADVSREIKELGGTWDNEDKSFRLPRSKAPASVKDVARRANESLREKQSQINALLKKNLPAKIAKSFKADDFFEKALQKVDTDIRESVKRITVIPKLTKAQKDKITREWRDNMDLYIKKFSHKNIRKLRSEVQKRTFEGQRLDTLAAAIEANYGVTRNKAKFLAHQESRLMLAAYKESKYAEAGVTKYQWRCVIGSAAHPVRPSHKALDGKIFDYTKPPITTAPGQPARRNNPGQDFNCRCMDIPII